MKRFISALLIAVMLLTVIPFSGLIGTDLGVVNASAYESVSGSFAYVTKYIRQHGDLLDNGGHQIIYQREIDDITEICYFTAGDEDDFLNFSYTTYTDDSDFYTSLFMLFEKYDTEYSVTIMNEYDYYDKQDIGLFDVYPQSYETGDDLYISGVQYFYETSEYADTCNSYWSTVYSCAVYAWNNYLKNNLSITMGNLGFTSVFNPQALPSKKPVENGLVKTDGVWNYYQDGYIDYSFVGMAKNDYGWWYVKNGTIDFSYTGMAKNQYGWFYMKNGKYDTTYTGMAKNQWGWWYMKNGKLDTTFTGMAKGADGWMYAKNGKLDTSFTGMAKNQYGWFYMKNGRLSTTYTGIAKNQYGYWYMKNGKLDTTYNGVFTAKSSGNRWKVVNGKATKI